MKNKLLSLLLVAGLTFATLTGCSADTTTDTADTAVTEDVVEDTVEDDADMAVEPEADTEEETAVEDMGELLMATTTSTADTGLLDYLTPIFKEDTGYDLKYTAVGTGEAISMGEDGSVDVILVHAKASEEAFVEAGYGVERFPVMYNDFVVVGPSNPVDTTDDITALYTAIADQELNFVNRGDDSGTDKMDVTLWATAGIDPSENPNYVESGSGMGDTITMANEMLAYCLTDRGTWLKMSTDADATYEIAIVCEADTTLLNQYGVIAINPDMYPDTNIDGANAFIEWICSDEIQAVIAEFGVDAYGQSLFFPNAGTDN